MVYVATCARGDCIVQRSIATGRIVDTLQCPCCGARYDLSGRIFAGPARENLRVPPYRFIGPGTIEFVDEQLEDQKRLLAEAGYVGEDVENLLLKLLQTI